MVGGEGFEPRTRKGTDLQSVAVGSISARCCVKLFAFMSASWSHLSDLNRRPFAYKASALPAELRWQKKCHDIIHDQGELCQFPGLIFLRNRPITYPALFFFWKKQCR